MPVLKCVPLRPDRFNYVIALELSARNVSRKEKRTFYGATDANSRNREAKGVK